MSVGIDPRVEQTYSVVGDVPGSVRWIARRYDCWRLWRNRYGRLLYRRLHRAGLVLASMVQYEAAPITDEGRPTIPDGASVGRWRGDDPAVPGRAPRDLEPTDVVLGTTVDDELAGYCVLSPRTVRVTEIGGTVDPAGVYLWDLFVEPAYRGRGLGTALLWRARADQLADEVGRVEAMVAADNRPSRRAFRAAGFEPTERVHSIGWGDRVVCRRAALESAPEREGRG